MSSIEAKTRLNEIAQGYQGAVVLLTACDLGVFAALGREAKRADELAAELELDARGLELTLLALAALEVVTIDGDRFRVADEMAPMLLPDSPETQASILNHNFGCLKSWAGLDEVLRTGSPPPRSQGGERGEKSLRNFICGMANVSRSSTEELVGKFDFSHYRKMLDVGGGPATSSIVLAQRNPELSCVVMDLAGPIEIAREEIEKAGVGDRVTPRVGDLFTDDFGEGFDLVYISNIIHMLSPDDVEMLYGKAAAALEPGGSVAVKDFFLDDSRTRPRYAALFSINMLVNTQSGRSYTLSESKASLERAGFGDFETIDVATASRFLVGRKR